MRSMRPRFSSEQFKNPAREDVLLLRTQVLRERPSLAASSHVQAIGLMFSQEWHVTPKSGQNQPQHIEMWMHIVYPAASQAWQATQDEAKDIAEAQCKQKKQT
jgi:hypothetical protein